MIIKPVENGMFQLSSRCKEEKEFLQRIYFDDYLLLFCKSIEDKKGVRTLVFARSTLMHPVLKRKRKAIK